MLTLTVCDIPNASSRTIDLFSLLGGTATPGGTWTDDNESGGLNLNTGILNAQLIRQSSVYTYTYTAPSNNGCADNHSRYKTIGGYWGYFTKMYICSSGGFFNFFSGFNGEI
ncbi:hypothetical protein ACFFWB_27105 [Flavobacterium procerum]|uniref:hypothetical protein n=1 Tax=Flavobacterium procerum TaxID=1455569 RepID=UPI0035E79C23